MEDLLAYLHFVVLPQVIDALIIGVALALVALGLTMIFGLLDVINLAHGELYMLGGYAAFTLLGWGAGYWSALVLVPVAGRDRRLGAGGTRDPPAAAAGGSRHRDPAAHLRRQPDPARCRAGGLGHRDPRRRGAARRRRQPRRRVRPDLPAVRVRLRPARDRRRPGGWSTARASARCCAPPRSIRRWSRRSGFRSGSSTASPSSMAAGSRASPACCSARSMPCSPPWDTTSWSWRSPSSSSAAWAASSAPWSRRCCWRRCRGWRACGSRRCGPRPWSMA